MRDWTTPGNEGSYRSYCERQARIHSAAKRRQRKRRVTPLPSECEFHGPHWDRECPECVEESLGRV